MKVLVIGAGGIARKHLDSLKKMGVEICGIYDTNTERADELALEYDTVAVKDLDLAISIADVAFLLTPPSTRMEYMRRLCAHCKNIFVEKPLAVTVKDAIEMERMVEENHLNCMVGFTQRFRPGYKEIKSLIDKGIVGDIIQAFSIRIGNGPGLNGKIKENWRTNRKYACGMTIESLAHDIDFLQSLVGKITSINGQIKSSILTLPQFDNNSDAVFKFDSGAIGSITCSWSSAINFNMKGVIGSKGTAFLQGDDIWDNTSLIVNLNGGEKKITRLHDLFQDGDGYLNEDRYFFECI